MACGVCEGGGGGGGGGYPGLVKEEGGVAS